MLRLAPHRWSFLACYGDSHPIATTPLLLLGSGWRCRAKPVWGIETLGVTFWGWGLSYKPMKEAGLSGCQTTLDGTLTQAGNQSGRSG